jgi:hypothetical protein
MADKSRGTALTVFALLFVLLAISDFGKPFSETAHFVFLGTPLSGKGNLVMGPLFGVALLIYAYGIWTMRRYALPVAYIYTGWVCVNMILFSIKTRNEPTHPSPVMAIASLVIGIGVPLATAIILSRREADLT